MNEHTSPLDKVTIVLHRPQYPENIGAAARAAWNMGLSRLTLVSPKNCDLTRILKMATISAADLVENMKVHDDLRTALRPFTYIVGTTARTGGPGVDSTSGDGGKTGVDLCRQPGCSALWSRG